MRSDAQNQAGFRRPESFAPGREKVAQASRAAVKPFSLMPWVSLRTGRPSPPGPRIVCEDCEHSGQAAIVVGVTHPISFSRPPQFCPLSEMDGHTGKYRGRWASVPSLSERIVLGGVYCEHTLWCRTGPYCLRTAPDSACFSGFPVFAGPGMRFESHLGHASPLVRGGFCLLGVCTGSL